MRIGRCDICAEVESVLFVIQIDTTIITLIIGIFHDTILIEVVQRSKEFSLFSTTGKREAMALYDSSPQHFVLPVSTSILYFTYDLTIGYVGTRCCLYLVENTFVIFRIQNFNHIFLYLHSNKTAIVYLHLTGSTFFRCHQNNTVRTTGTIDSCCRSIFQDFDRFDISRVYVTDGASCHTHTRHTITTTGNYITCLNRQTIDNVQWT